MLPASEEVAAAGEKGEADAWGYSVVRAGRVFVVVVLVTEEEEEEEKEVETIDEAEEGT